MMKVIDELVPGNRQNHGAQGQSGYPLCAASRPKRRLDQPVVVLQIFNFTDRDIQTLVIETEGKNLKFERTTQETQPWKMTDPEDIPASEAAISFLVDLLIESEINQSFFITLLKN